MSLSFPFFCNLVIIKSCLIELILYEHLKYLMTKVYPIPGGTLHILPRLELLSLDELLGFASRANPRRPYLFVSKVLGRHIPCRPSRMRETYRLLVREISNVLGPVWVIGLAETATGLAGGLADSLAREHYRTDVVFQHTTRLELFCPLLAAFEETHSHAPSHLLHLPHSDLLRFSLYAQTLVLVDDEISTGQTIEKLGHAVLSWMPNINRLVIVSLVNWLDTGTREAIDSRLITGFSRSLRIDWVSLFDGSYMFEPSEDYHPAVLPANVESSRPSKRPRSDLGRRGRVIPAGGLVYSGLESIDVENHHKIAVVGTGECALEPFLLAEILENAGHDVTVQCTTRSPILLGGAITSTLPCLDPYGQGVGYYLHNPPSPYTLNILVYERNPGSESVVASGDWHFCEIPENP